MRFRLLTAAAGAALAAAPALAAKADFQTCDGYPAPGKKGDGITSGGWLFGLATTSVDYRRNQTAFGAGALQACDRALADPLLLPSYRLRKAHLLQARALHLIATDDFQGALETLDQSNAAAGPDADPFFADSIGAGNRALKAVALYRLGRKPEARAELDAVEAARPFANSLRALSRSIRLVFEPELDTYFDLLKQGAPYDPNMLSPMFKLSVLYARFDEAAPVYGQISHDLPRGRGSWTISGLADHKYEQISERAELAAMMGYLLEAKGNGDAAAKLIAGARTDLDDAMEKPVPKPDGQIGGKAQKDYVARVASAKKGLATLDAWQKAIAFRKASAALPWSDFMNRLPKELPREAPVLLDLVQSRKAADDGERVAIAETTRMVRDMFEQDRRKALSLKLADLAKLLPRPETAKTKPTYKGAGDGWIMDGNNGFYVKKHKDSEEISVVYGSDKASAAMVEELGMLAAAMKTRQAGKDAFLIDSRMIIQRTLYVGGYTAGAGTPSGHEVRLRILPVSSAALPAGLEATRWRLIDADKVHAALYEKYAPAAEPAAKK